MVDPPPASVPAPHATASPLQTTKPPLPKDEPMVAAKNAPEPQKKDPPTAEKESAAKESKLAAVEAKPTGPMGDLSFEEKKRKRADRWGIPVVETSQPEYDSKSAKSKTGGSREPKDKKQKGPEKPVLSRGEIEKRMKRGGPQTDELKAMLRLYKFDRES